MTLFYRFAKIDAKISNIFNILVTVSFLIDFYQNKYASPQCSFLMFGNTIQFDKACHSLVVHYVRATRLSGFITMSRNAESGFLLYVLTLL